MEVGGRVYDRYPPAQPSKTAAYTPYARHDSARSRPSSVPAVGVHPPVPCCESPAPGRYGVKAAAAPVASSDAAAAAVASVTAATKAAATMAVGTTTVVAERTMTVTPASGDAPAVATAAVLLLVRIPQSRLSAFSGKKGKQVGRTTIKQHSTRGSEVECATIKRTHDLKGRTIQRKNQALNRWLDQPRRILPVRGRIEPKGTSFVRL